jgi:TonB family protein
MKPVSAMLAIMAALAPAPALGLSFVIPDRLDHLYVHTCHNYPASAAVAGQSGMTVLSVHTAPEGQVLSSSVTQGSGHGELDGAARICVKGWRYPPAAKAIERPVRIIWARTFEWHDAGEDACPDLLSNVRPQKDAAPTILDYRITPDRRLVRPVVAKSSGNRTLDRLALRCTAGWRPLRRPSAKGDVPWKITLRWPVAPQMPSSAH